MDEARGPESGREVNSARGLERPQRVPQDLGHAASRRPYPREGLPKSSSSSLYLRIREELTLHALTANVDTFPS